MTLIRLRLLSRPSTNNRRQKRVRCYVNWTMTGTAPCLLTRIRHALRHQCLRSPVQGLRRKHLNVRIALPNPCSMGRLPAYD